MGAAIFFTVVLLVAGLGYTFAPLRLKLERRERMRAEKEELRAKSIP